MAKIALLIGVSEYESGLNPLPGAVQDVEAIQRVLQHSEMGGFTKENITLLQNPDRQKMEEAIEQLFRNRQRADLVLLFFSGHGLKDDTGKLYLATCKTRKTTQGELVRSTAVPANFVHESMNRSRSKHQVVILDCCFSGAFAEGMSAKDDGSVDIQAQLGGEGRAVLASSTSTQYSFEQKDQDLSIYTHYLIQGIESGEADRDNDGEITVNELHDYVKQKVQEVSPAMNPEIYAAKEGFNIRIAHTLIIDPKQRYRKEVERVTSSGKISEIVRLALDAKQVQLGISAEEARAIEVEVLQPSRRHQQNVQQYEQKFIEAFLRAYPLSSTDRNDLKYLQSVLGLQEEEVQAIETQIVAKAKIIGTAEMQQAIDRPPAGSPSTSTIPVQSQPSGAPAFQLSFLKDLRLNSKRQLVWGVTAAAIVIGAIGGYGILRGYATGELGDLLYIAETLQSQGDYEGCIKQFQGRSVDALPPDAQTLLGSCQISQAMALAKDKQLTEAIKVLGQIPSSSPVYAKAASLLSYWSDLLLKQAEAQYDTGDKDGAIRLATAIPANSPLYSKAQESVVRWSDEWVRNRDHLQTIHDVLKVNDLKTAMTEVEKITTLYWVKQAHNIILAQITGIIAYEQSIGGNPQKIESARQLQNTAEQLLHSAQVTANERSRKATSDPLQLPPDLPDIQAPVEPMPSGHRRFPIRRFPFPGMWQPASPVDYQNDTEANHTTHDPSSALPTNPSNNPPIEPSATPTNPTTDPPVAPGQAPEEPALTNPEGTSLGTPETQPTKPIEPPPIPVPPEPLPEPIEPPPVPVPPEPSTEPIEPTPIPSVPADPPSNPPVPEPIPAEPITPEPLETTDSAPTSSSSELSPPEPSDLSSSSITETMPETASVGSPGQSDASVEVLY